MNNKVLKEINITGQTPLSFELSQHKTPQITIKMQYNNQF